MTSKDYKLQGKAMLSGNWGTAIVVMLVTSLILGLGNSFGPVVASQEVNGIEVNSRLNLLQLVIGGAMSVGNAAVYLSFLREGKSPFTRLFDGFSQCFVASVIASLIVGIAVGVGLALLIIPGIILSLMFSQTFYILRDHPDMDGLSAVKASMDMMKGHKMELFKLELSFIPWFIACVLVLPLFYVIPYYTATITAYYENLKQESGF